MWLVVRSSVFLVMLTVMTISHCYCYKQPSNTIDNKSGMKYNGKMHNTVKLTIILAMRGMEDPYNMQRWVATRLLI